MRHQAPISTRIREEPKILMAMTVVHIWKMRMDVYYRLVPMPMSVFYSGWDEFVMRMLMVFVMLMIVFVSNLIMRMCVAMPFSQM